MLNPSKTLNALLALGLVASLATVSACGRAGAPQKPSAAAAGNADPQEEAEVADRPFILDGLLN